MKKKKKNKTMRNIILILMLISISVFYFNYEIGPYEHKNNHMTIVSIPKGANILEISDVLKKNKVIKNKICFILLSKVTRMDKSIKAGTYNIPKSYSNKDILTLLNSGKIYRNIVKVTIPEGYEAHQIAEKLAKLGLVDKERFLNLVKNPDEFKSKFSFLQESDITSLEGFLFPDTYFIDKKYSEDVIIEIMLKRFDEVYKEKYQKKKDEMNLTLNQFITIASIIEREAKLESERDIISAVFYNRLKIDMPLQSCATVEYILGDRKKILSYDDVKIDSPYNTYKNKGLPPGPIASPGEPSMKAALYPANVNYLYFVAKKDGSHSFSTTYEEHLKRKVENENK